MRVISGSAGGLQLASPKGVELRPTQDRIRQVIFSSLAARVPGCQVLDLFAGTGSLGIEALSRGAKSVCFVEKEARCVRTIQANLLTCKMSGIVVQSDVLTWLERPVSDTFDLIFADPPYEKVKGELSESYLPQRVAPLLRPGGLFIWEHFSGQYPGKMEKWEVTRHQRYGETGLTFLRLIG
ncbi:MAG: 16S rRNA (guanine(966)-N(2))-methyltransferase RsmD [Candidatus Methylacidiphilales bacterium]|nr:16S rRNA (guanine(966)-N(2))-methyltransferase RsmD [Candidatus Methylacidiphilales bacterium]